MSSFSADWLTLREPADRRARAVQLTRLVVEALPGGSPEIPPDRSAVTSPETRPHPVAVDRVTDPVVAVDRSDAPADERRARVVDLAGGTGANVRYLTPLFRTRPEWLLVDHDPALLNVARERLGGRVLTRVADLSDRRGREVLVSGRDLVTASALLDLVSDAWLHRLLSACREAGAATLFALNYDGRMACTPEDPEDERVRGLVNRHQRGDKGFGQALGPDAAHRTARILGGLGYTVVRERSDWVIGADEAALQSALIDGWAGAAVEMSPSDKSVIRAWQQRRLAHLSAERSMLIVGHEDVAGLPLP